MTHSYLASLLDGRQELPAAFSSPPLAWLNRLRASAVDRVGALTVPTTRDEEWRFTDISPLTKIPFQPVSVAPPLAAREIERFSLPEVGARLVFVDGIYAPHLSFNHADIVVENFPLGIAAHWAKVERHLGLHAAFADNAFAALNTAFLRDGALIIVPRNVQVAAPLHLLFMATQSGKASYPRTLVLAESDATVTVIEDFVASQEAAYFTNAVSEIALAENARVNHVRVQREGTEAFHIAHGAVSLAQGSRYQSVGVAFGARISRHTLNVLHAASRTECTIDGLALIGDRQLADSHTTIDHAHPHGSSRQLHKCIVGGTARAVFNGKIVVRPGAQRTDSTQSSRNVLLSGKARIDTKPQLEIFADDVKCAHGATVGQLDDDEVFYLRSRGLSDMAARSLLTYAFGAEIIDRIPVPSLRQHLERTVLEQTAMVLS